MNRQENKSKPYVPQHSAKEGANTVSSKLDEQVDYYFNDQGLMVFTATYLLKRGYCCQSGCTHCPY